MSNDTISPEGADRAFAVGDKVRVESSWLERKGDVYTVEAVADDRLRVTNGSTTLCYKRERFIHA